MSHNFTLNFSYQARLLDHVRAILKSKADLFVSFELANDEQDTKQATDMVLTVKGGQCIAVRVRRPEHRKWLDITIRCRSKTGAKTELDKLRDGWGDWYVYAWEDHNHSLSRWCILDLNCMRKAGLLDQPRIARTNGDGTAFVTIPLSELFIAGAMPAWGGMHPSEKTLAALKGGQAS